MSQISKKTFYPTLTVCIITKNEENNISQLLENISEIADEIIIVDNNSNDKTVEISKKYNAEIIIYPEEKEFEQRNLYLNSATKDWIFIIDADERIDAINFKKEFYNKLNLNKDYVAFYIPIYNFYGEGKWSESMTARLFKNQSFLEYDNAEVHTSIQPSLRKVYGYDLSNKMTCFKSPIYHLDGIQRERSKNKRNDYLKKILICIDRYEGNNDEIRFHNYLGIEYAARGKYKEACDEFEIVAKAKLKNSVLPYYFISRSYLMMGNIKKSEEYIDKYIDLCSCGEILFSKEVLKERLSRGYITKADICVQKKDLVEAFNNVKKIEESSSKNLNLYWLLKQMGETNKNYLDKAIEENPFLLQNEIYKDVFRPNVYEFQSSFISDIKNLKIDIL